VSQVLDFIVDFESEQRDILTYFHELLTLKYQLRDKISYNIPFYYKRSWICYLNPIKNTAIELAFPRGNELSNEQGLLHSKGRKQVMSVEFSALTEVPYATVEEIINEAIILDETQKYASKRTRKI
jgi:hypothetical protein